MTTKTAGHTPGPWHVDKSGAGLEIRKEKSIHAITVLAHEAEANARLIAAAPELLEALENIISFGEASEWDKATTGCQILLADAKAAIRKARGE